MSEEGHGAASHAKQAAAAAEGAAQDGAALLDTPTALSQTNVNQVTAAPAPGEAGKWRCEACTYENYTQSRKCTMCRSPKPVLGEDIFKLQDGASALPALEPCGAAAEAIAERLKPLRISSPQGHSSACAVNKWPCPTCTYENWPKSLKCAMCGAPPPPAPAPPAPPPAARPALGANEAPGAGAAADAEARRSRRAHSAADWIWLQACLGVVEGSARGVEAYLAHGGDPARALSAHEVQLLNRASAFDAGHTLVHLAIRFQRQEILSTLLSRISGGGPGIKRSPSYIAPDLAAGIRQQLAGCVRFKKGSFPCRYINDFPTFTLPCEIEDLPAAIQEQLFSELLDREAQQTLEEDPPTINWSQELSDRLGSRLYALWNRSAGDCLPDAVWQAAAGVADRDNALRGALAEALAGRGFYARWAAWERAQAAPLQYAPSEAQLRGEWARLAAAAARAGAPLHQLHVFVLAHVLRRPLIVYGVDVVRSHRGDALGFARFRGIYLPLLWERDRAACSKSPLCLGYTRGHFSALVPMEPYTQRAYICRERERQEEDQDVTFLPLTDADGKLLPVHFLNCDEMSDPESVVRRWVRAYVTRGGVLTARAAVRPRPLLQAQMLEEWLNHYRRLAQQTRGPFPPRLPPAAADYCSEPDTDDE